MKSRIKGKERAECSTWMNIQCGVVQSQFLELHLIIINKFHNFQMGTVACIALVPSLMIFKH